MRPVLILLQAAVLAVCAGCARRSAVSAEDCNLIFISIDTLRADRLGCYGYERETSPNLDAFSERCIVFSRAYSHSPKTTCSHMTMFTALYPTVHDIHMFDLRRGAVPYRLDEKIKTLAEHLAARGFYNAAFSGGGHVSAEYGFDRGFEDRYNIDDRWKRVAQWIKEHHRRKFFLFLHTYAVHDPYLPPEPYYSMFNPGYQGGIKPVGALDWHHQSAVFWKNVDEDSPEDIKQLNALYDGAVRFMDEKMMKPLLDLLHARKLMDRTIIVFTSDHGEEFKEHGGFKHELVYEEILHVPLMIYLPPALAAEVNPPKKIDTRVGLIDLMPTLLDLLGIPYDEEEIQGMPLFDVATGAPAPERPHYAVRADAFIGPPAQILYEALYAGDDKLIRNRTGKKSEWELYNLARDPGEQENLAGDGQALFEEMRSAMERFDLQNEELRTARGYRSVTTSMQDRTLQKLRSLGYVR
ncbi:MAG: sulfatase [Kiritimatiellae bacterium]|nr:sulfatase [Kiritimatiellia bacterium]